MTSLTNKPRTESLSRTRRHPGRLRHGTGDGRALPRPRHGSAGIPPAATPPLPARPCRYGTPFPAIGLTTILDAVGSRTPCWTTPLEPGAHPRGRGLALGYWRGTSMTSACHITIGGDGRPVVTMGGGRIIILWHGAQPLNPGRGGPVSASAPMMSTVQTGGRKNGGLNSNGVRGQARCALPVASANPVEVQRARDVIDPAATRRASASSAERSGESNDCLH